MQTVGMGSGGLCHTLRPGAVWFDLTTNSPTVVREVGRHCTAKGLALLDSPVSGGPAGARSGKLAMYVGGDEATFTRYRALLDAIGDQVMYVGSIGAGNCAKLVHNCASFTIRTAIAEVFTLGVKAGVAPLALWHAIRQGVSGRRRTFDGIGEQYLQDRYQPAAFALRLAHKDMTLARGLAQELGVPMKLADAAHEDMAAGVARGWGDWDSRAFMQLQNERAGVNIKVSAEDVARTLARD
jgi:3-hydroxyisobutyrate dehydrogenase